MPISINELISATSRNSPNFLGSPKIGGENMPSIGTDGELKINGQSIIAKSREYKLPICWQNIAEYTLDLFHTHRLNYGFGITIFPYTGSSIIYIDPSVSTNGNGTFSSPYNIWPNTIPDNSLVLLKEYTTLAISSINITAVNIIIGSYDADTGERIIDSQKLGTISYTTATKLFALPSSGLFTLSGVKFTSTTANSNNIVSNTNLEVKVEYCVFSGISSLVGGTVNGSLVDTTGKVTARFNKVMDCTTNAFITTGVARIYCNDITYSFITPSTVYGIKITGNAYCDIHHNYMINNMNYGALISIANTGRTVIRGNYLFGGKSDVAGQSYGISCNSGNADIHDNYVCNSSIGINASNTSKIYKNIMCSEYNNYTGIIGGAVIGNTVVRLNGTNGVAIVGNGGISNNIVDSNSLANFATGIQTMLGLSQSTYNNVFGSTAKIVDGGGSSLSIAGTTNVNTSSYLDYKFHPLATSPALNSGVSNTTRGAIAKQSGVGSAMNLFSPVNGLSSLQSVIDTKADLSSPSFIGSLMINGNQPQTTIFKDFGIESTKTVTGIGSAILGTYTLPNIAGSGLIRMTLVYSTIGAGSKTLSIKINGALIGEILNITTAAKTSRTEIVCANNTTQNAQSNTITTDGSTTMTSSSVITSGSCDITINGSGTTVSDSITLKSIIIEQI
jgi:hypothetical protein